MAIKISKVPVDGYKYIPFSQREEANPFIVYVKPLTSKQLMALEDKVVKRSGDSEVTLSAGEFSFNVCKLSVIAWEGIEDSDGEVLKLRKNADGTTSDESICFIPSEIITEIANTVAAISRDPSKTQVFFSEDEDIVEKSPKKKPKEAVE